MAYKIFKLKVNTPNGLLFEDDILQIEIKETQGYITILADHAPVVGSFLPSLCYIRDQKNNRVPVVINQGVFYFNENQIDIYTDFFYFVKDITEDIFAKRQKIVDETIRLSKLNQTNDNMLDLKLKENLQQLKKLSTK